MRVDQERPVGFDLTVHHRDKKTGKINKITPYRCVSEKGKPDRYEQPPDSGNWFYENGERINPIQPKPEPKPEVQPLAARAASNGNGVMGSAGVSGKRGPSHGARTNKA